MTEQRYIAREDPPFEKMTTAEILAFFDWLNFKDEQGHPLRMCYDFIRCQLVAHPKGERTYFSASYKRIAGEPYGVSVGMMIYDRQMSIIRGLLKAALGCIGNSLKKSNLLVICRKL